MTRWSKTTPTLGEREIFGDEDVAAMRAEVEELATAVGDLSAQLHAQFTTIAAHAEIAREQSEFARDEARADLERTRTTLIGLIEQVRQVPGSSYPPPDAPVRDDTGCDRRLDALENRVGAIAASVEHCVDRQRELADMMGTLLDSLVSNTNNAPLVDLSVA